MSPVSSSSRPASLPLSPRRPALRPGSLQRLLRPPDPSDDDAPTPRSSRGGRVLLQVTNITPALSGADPFSGHHGFYLRLSDSARSCYVSLHADHDDLILANGLHIGQVIEVEHLVPSVPAPVLRKFRVLPGRYPCIQQEPADDAAAAAAACSGAAEIKEVVSERPRRPSPTPPIPERRALQASGSPSAISHRHRSRSISNLSEAGTAAAAKRRGADVVGKLRKISVTSVDGTSTDDDDEESDVSSLSSVRKNWDFTGSIKDRRPVAPRRRGNSVSPSKSGPNSTITQNDAAIDPMESVRRKAEKAFKVLSKRSSAKMSRESSNCTVARPQSASSSSGIKWCENNVMWSSLSANLMKHGKEAVKQRDMALQAVLDGLLEASTTEKLIKCLSTYSELQSDKEDDPKEHMDRFLKFSQELDRAIFIAQSQTKLRQVKACGFNSTSSASTKAALKAALDRKQSAILWIRAAIEADLSPFSNHTRPIESPKLLLAESKPVTPLFCCSKPKCNCNKRSSRKTSDGSTEGSNLNAAMDLAIALRSECNCWFLKYIDKFLDDIESETVYAPCDSQVAGLLQQLKRVDDWLNRVAQHERMVSIDRTNKDSMFSEEEESDACERVRRKIYGALLRHVQYAAMALEGLNGVTDEEKEEQK
ncbi:hypothetical protein E2562_031862 [Oryza meyeriana var. granulata]|uniref:Uncharacterized protein n=1 Tax=Oryza meyeriana var. granulata TaxID=110450 RepID=A0A6G1C1Q4_9ORYZ|nr:hypothetical protein E2562_031862 [Oryza meyeriana var. granulata]